MSPGEWLRIIAMAASLIAITLSLITLQRTRKQAATQLAKSMAPQWAEKGYRAGVLAEPTKINGSVNISTFIGPDGLSYISAADTKRLGEQASRVMASRRRVKVYQPTRDTRAGTNGTVYYGQRFSAAIFDHIEFVDPPRGECDRQWIRDHLMTRIAPAGKVRLSKEMVPHGKSD